MPITRRDVLLGTGTDDLSAGLPEIPVNLYAEDGAKSPNGRVILHGTPGLSVQTVTGDQFGASRHGHTVEYDGGAYIYSWSPNRVTEFVYNGSTFVSTSLLEPTYTGTLGYVTSADNGAYVVYVAVNTAGEFEEARYITTSTGAVTDISSTLTALGHGDPKTVTFADGYFIVTTDADKILVSNLNDPSTWDALDFGSAEADPDGIVGADICDNQLIVFGTSTYEIFQNVGGSGFPFQRIPGAIFDIGLYHPKLLAKGRNGLYFVGSSDKDAPAVYVTKGGDSQKVSTPEIDKLIQSHVPPFGSGNAAFAYSQEGHSFCVFTLDATSDATYVYDESTGLWHERQTFNGTTDTEWVAMAAFQLDGEIYALCRGLLYPYLVKLDYSVHQDLGEDMKRQFVVSLPSDLVGPYTLNTVELTLESGGGGAESSITLEVSRDGRTWSTARGRTIKQSGTPYQERHVWRRNGRIRNYGYLRFKHDGNAFIRIKRLMIEVE